MTRDRGISTPLDVGVGLLLVAVAVAVISGIPAQEEPGKPVQGSGGALLGETVEISVDTGDGDWQVSGSMGGLLADAAIAGKRPLSSEDRQFREAVAQSVSAGLDRADAPIQVVAYCAGVDHPRPLVVGQAPPPDRAVTTEVYTLPEPESRGNESTTDCRPSVVVRRWDR